MRATVASNNGSVYASVDVADGVDVDAVLRELCAVRTFVTAPLYPLPIAPKTSLERLIASAVKGLLGNAVIELSWTGDEGFIFSVEAVVTAGGLTVKASLGLTRLTTEVWANGVRRFARTTDPGISMLPIEELVLALVTASVDVAITAVKAWQSGRCVATRLLGSQVRICPKAEPQAIEATPKPVAAPALA